MSYSRASINAFLTRHAEKVTHLCLLSSQSCLAWKNAFRGVVNPALSVIGRGQPIRCLVSLLRGMAHTLPRNKPAFNGGTGKDCALQATRAAGGHNGSPVQVTRTRRNERDSARRSRTYVRSDGQRVGGGPRDRYSTPRKPTFDLSLWRYNQLSVSLSPTYNSRIRSGQFDSANNQITSLSFFLSLYQVSLFQ